MEEFLRHSEQKRDVISQDHSEGCSGNNVKGARVDANRAVAIIQVRPRMARPQWWGGEESDSESLLKVEQQSTAGPGTR